MSLPLLIPGALAGRKAGQFARDGEQRALGYIPPAEAETNYYRQLKIAADEAALT